METFTDGKRWEGHYVDSHAQGRWVGTWPDGRREEGDYVDGAQQGVWLETRADGSVWEQDYRDGEKAGDPRVPHGGAPPRRHLLTHDTHPHPFLSRSPFISDTPL